MASFFQSFRASLMPKQLLRFALSRLDVLDKQTLDLEKLDFALGRNTVLEFRDVGLVLQKLEKLLGLPPAFSLQKAKVLVLRVTVPMDFYTSPITVEVDGVDIRLKVAPKQDKAAKHGEGAGVSDAVPTAADLAQAFLKIQPVAEKEELEQELEQALAAGSQDLGASVAISEPDSVDGSTVGTGQNLSLPTFLTGFLQGIIDRMQIRVQGVRFQVDVDVPLDPSASTLEPVTFELSLDTINVEGVTTPTDSPDEGPLIVHKDGKRHILLDNIRAALITEANVFSSMVSSPAMLSPMASRSPVVTGSRTFPAAGLASSVSSDSMMAGSGDLSQSRYLPGDGEVAFNIPYDLGGNTGSDQVVEPSSPLSTPRASVYRGSPPPHTLTEDSESTILQRFRALSPYGQEAESQLSLQPPEHISQPVALSPAASVHSDSNISSGSAPSEDLTQSHLYSHEEAESMYMSAFSQAESTRLRGGMPGAWDAFEDSPHDTVAAAVATPSALHEGSDRAENSAQQTLYEAQPVIEEAEPAPEDIPTPRGPPRLVKEVLSVDSVSVYVPSPREHVHLAAPDMEKSISPDMPGAFSLHASATVSPKVMPIPTQPAQKTSMQPSIEIALKPVEFRFDASIGFLVAMVAARLLEAAQGEPSEATGLGSSVSGPKSKTPDIKVAVEKLSVLLLERLPGVSTIARKTSEKQPSNCTPVLLQIILGDLRGTVSSEGSQTAADLSVEKLRFGYANEDIISFDRSVQLFESVANTFPSAGQDIAVKATMGSDTSRIEVNTLPLHVKLDLQRLDEAFSWFGGLSGFLNMGASITSTASRAGKTPAKSAQKPRGVRFEEPSHPGEGAASNAKKIDLRINGLQLDVVGKDCSAVLNTSALKLINRSGHIGIHFSKIQVLGPYLNASKSEAPVAVEIVDTRLDYFLLPRTKDLEELLELITPSQTKFDEDEDEIMVDTLLRQRRKGPVLSFTVGKVRVDAGNLQQLSCLPGLAEDLAKLGTVAKYLPEDDRPGLLTLGHVKSADCRVHFGGRFGAVQASLADLELAHITVPALVAIALGHVSLKRNTVEQLVATSPAPATGSSQNPPVLRMRMIDDIEPVLKLILTGLSVEYRVPTIMDILDLAEDATPQDYEASLAASVANLGGQAHAAIQRAPSEALLSTGKAKESKPMKVDVALRDCLVGLNPLGLPSKLTLALTDAHIDVVPGTKDNLITVTRLKRAAVLLIDDVSILESGGAPFASTRRPQAAPSPQVTELCGKGYVNICQISSAGATVKATKDAAGETRLEVEVRDDLLILETCADSTQTLIALAGALAPPTPPSKENKYRTSVVPFEDLLNSIRLEAFGGAEGDYDFDNDFAVAQELGESIGSDEELYGGPNDNPLNLDSQLYEEGALHEELFNAASESTKIEDTNDGVLLSTASLGVKSSSELESSSSDLSIHEDYFAQPPQDDGTTHRWNPKEDGYAQNNNSGPEHYPLKVSVRDMHIIWNLFDGYDWARTREVIARAVQEVETKAHERRTWADRSRGYDEEFDEDETVIGDCLFNSIYIGIPASRDPRELTQAINQGLQDFGDTESVATTTVTQTTVRAAGQHRRSKSLKLNRSKRHKITFELKGVNADMVAFPPGSGETLSSVDVRVRDLDIFDHVPTSTWKKFATYDIDAGEREMGASMVHLEIMTIRPVQTPVTELVVKAKVLPLRLHVDQDALDFIIRFFQFKDESVPVASPSDILFIHRAEISRIPVKLDFKPKRVDYAGLRSGSTTELMNFVILEEARLVLHRVILYGVPGLEDLGKRLDKVWMKDVIGNQLPTFLAGLASVRSLVNAGSGFRDLIEVPIREYRKDGRIIRSIKKGATAFAKSTGIEVVKLGAKLAIGTQNALQGAEDLLAPHQAGEGSSSAAGVAVLGDDWEVDEYEEESHRKISLYAHQPLGVVQGIRGAYAGLARDLAVARDAIIAVPAEVMQSQNAQGAAKAVLKQAPTIILRPAIGATRAIGQTLLGVTNSLDPMHRRRVDAKYKK
ncbi:uncharacterized protein B0T15DRAFT_90514 [Chaetomium strumarium]|uniref:Autophagy-related protein 2 n=1 Tax=Chaetomium strumarium TaxID=1170767 RepID=A0AAJ0GXE5_9PEZI|nr:hypothetical protein B0T15DRAFT_90514 [Chaetomium strumarium]